MLPPLLLLVLVLVLLRSLTVAEVVRQLAPNHQLLQVGLNGFLVPV
jgi:hypothetical protein